MFSLNFVVKHDMNLPVVNDWSNAMLLSDWVRRTSQKDLRLSFHVMTGWRGFHFLQQPMGCCIRRIFL